MSSHCIDFYGAVKLDGSGSRELLRIRLSANTTCSLTAKPQYHQPRLSPGTATPPYRPASVGISFLVDVGFGIMTETLLGGFRSLLHFLDGYIDDEAPYYVDASQTILPRLPTELRHEIYSYLFPQRCALRRTSIRNETHRREGALPLLSRFPILSTNVSTRLDAGLYLILKCDLVVDDACIPEMIGFLQLFPGDQGFQSVRQLTICGFSGNTGNHVGSMHFIERCKRLRRLTLQWNTHYLMRTWNFNQSDEVNWLVAHTDGYQLVSLNDAANHYSLTSLLTLPSLEDITLTAHIWTHRLHAPGEETEWRAVDAMALIMQVAEWLRNGFSALSRFVKVTVALPTLHFPHTGTQLFMFF
ncbi:hypothetical protein M011DRAFT_476846 [Sporormia fimetaria CBS 119925]|uniref:Uncharacterized protein n=1 Tax=Sporormia fimetaria CBS 119925 TaxID=1340428 RepID=A0A6A6VCC6_9PLEO|nr:hypothetical protein M011DRAFT_476846 [Sporormia fimetaria CBS 119925]